MRIAGLALVAIVVTTTPLGLGTSSVGTVSGLAWRDGYSYVKLSWDDAPGTVAVSRGWWNGDEYMERVLATDVHGATFYDQDVPLTQVLVYQVRRTVCTAEGCTTSGPAEVEVSRALEWEALDLADDLTTSPIEESEPGLLPIELWERGANGNHFPARLGVSVLPDALHSDPRDGPGALVLSPGFQEGSAVFVWAMDSSQTPVEFSDVSEGTVRFEWCAWSTLNRVCVFRPAEEPVGSGSIIVVRATLSSTEDAPAPAVHRMQWRMEN